MFAVRSYEDVGSLQGVSSSTGGQSRVSSSWLTAFHTSFPDSVLDVFLMGSEEEVVEIDAGAVIAEVADAETWRDRAECGGPEESVVADPFLADFLEGVPAVGEFAMPGMAEGELFRKVRKRHGKPPSFRGQFLAVSENVAPPL